MIWPQIKAIICGVLGNEIDLFDAVGDQGASLRDDVALKTAAMGAAHAGNDAKAARMIAAFGDLQVGKVAGRQAKARSAKIRDENRARGDVKNRTRGIELLR